MRAHPRRLRLGGSLRRHPLAAVHDHLLLLAHVGVGVGVARFVEIVEIVSVRRDVEVLIPPVLLAGVVRDVGAERVQTSERRRVAFLGFLFLALRAFGVLVAFAQSSFRGVRRRVRASQLRAELLHLPLPGDEHQDPAGRQLPVDRERLLARRRDVIAVNRLAREVRRHRELPRFDF